MVWKSFNRKGVGRIINSGGPVSFGVQGSWDADFAKFLEKEVPEMRAELLRKAVGKLIRELVARSPLDTGRFRCSWVAGVDAANRDIPVFTVDDGGEGSIERVLEALSELKQGQKFIISNNLPYALMLEYGWSNQAPQGFVVQSIDSVESMLQQATDK